MATSRRTTWSVTWDAEISVPSTLDPVEVAAMALDGILLNESRSFTVAGPHGVEYVVDLADRDEAGAEPQIRAMTDAEFWLAFASVSRVMRDGHDDDGLEHGHQDPLLADWLFAEGSWRFGARGMNRLVEWIAQEQITAEHLVRLAHTEPLTLTDVTRDTWKGWG